MISLAASRSNLSKTGVAFLLLSLSACGKTSVDQDNPASSADGGASASADGGGTSADGSGDKVDAGSSSTTPPTVVSTAPPSGGLDVAINGNVSATFSEAMDGASLTATTFTVSFGASPLAGKVIYANSTAVFWPASHLARDAEFTATTTTGAKSASGVALGTKHSWSFTTGAKVAPGLPVDLGTAGNFVMLAKAGISTVPGSVITGNIGVSPAAASYITGFSLTADSSKVFSTTPQVSGKVYASDYMIPTPANLTTAVSDMETAFTDAAARAPDVTELGAGDIGGKTLVPGVYKWGTGLLIPTDVTLVGNATDVWIFQIAQKLTMSSATKVVLSGGAQPKNVFWQVAGLVDVGTTAHCEGIVMSQTAITLGTGASINGRLLAQTAITVASSTVAQPAP